MTSQSVNVTDAVPISESSAKRVQDQKGLSDAALISGSSGVHAQKGVSDADTISETTGVHTNRFTPPNAVEIDNIVVVGGTLNQYDTWRSVPRFDNMLFLICRTAVGTYDTDLSNINVWTVDHDGLNEFLRITKPSDHGWVTYGHPEWSPDGQEVVIATETVTEWQLVIVDSSSWS